MRLKVPNIASDLAQEVVNIVQRIRQVDLKKAPSISETLDWAKALMLLNAHRLDEQLLNDTLHTILKYEGDIRKAQDELKDYLQKKARLTQQGRVESEKDLLH